MSRSYKQPYTKSKRFDKSCRCHGGCSYCYDNRMHKNDLHPDLDEELRISEQEIIEEYDTAKEQITLDLQIK